MYKGFNLRPDLRGKILLVETETESKCHSLALNTCSDTTKIAEGAYFPHSNTFQNLCPSREAEKVYMQLVDKLKSGQFSNGESFRENFFDSFSKVCPAEQSQWFLYYIRCQINLGIKIQKDLTILSR